MSKKAYDTRTQPWQQDRRKRLPNDWREKRTRCAMKRILTAIEQHHGHIDAACEGAAIDFLEKTVTNRRNDLGTRRGGEFRRTLITAWRRLIGGSSPKIEYDDEKNRFMLTYAYTIPIGHPRNPNRKVKMAVA